MNLETEKDEDDFVVSSRESSLLGNSFVDARQSQMDARASRRQEGGPCLDGAIHEADPKHEEDGQDSFSAAQARAERDKQVSMFGALTNESRDASGSDSMAFGSEVDESRQTGKSGLSQQFAHIRVKDVSVASAGNPFAPRAPQRDKTIDAGPSGNFLPSFHEGDNEMFS